MDSIAWMAWTPPTAIFFACSRSRFLLTWLAIYRRRRAHRHSGVSDHARRPLVCLAARRRFISSCGSASAADSFGIAGDLHSVRRRDVSFCVTATASRVVCEVNAREEGKMDIKRTRSSEGRRHDRSASAVAAAALLTPTVLCATGRRRKEMDRQRISTVDPDKDRADGGDAVVHQGSRTLQGHGGQRGLRNPRLHEYESRTLTKAFEEITGIQGQARHHP